MRTCAPSAVSSRVVVARRSDSLMRRRAQSRINVRPCANDATAEITGTKSGMVVRAHLKAGELVGLHGGGVSGAHDAGAKARERGKHVGGRLAQS